MIVQKDTNIGEVLKNMYNEEYNKSIIEIKKADKEDNIIIGSFACCGCLVIYLFFLFTVWFISWVF